MAGRTIMHTTVIITIIQNVISCYWNMLYFSEKIRKDSNTNLSSVNDNIN